MAAASREVGRISVRVVPDTDGFRRSLKRQLEAITKGLEAKVDIDPDLKGFRQKVNAATKGMDAHIQVHADTARARAEMLALQKSGGRGGIFSTLGASISEMTQSMGQSIATARPFGVSIVAIAAAASLAVPAIGLMSGALVALPGILSAIVAPLGAVLMGMEGIKQALVNTGWAVLDKKGKLKPGEQLAKIQDSVSKVFETGLTPVFTKLLAIIPALQEGFGAIAQGLVGMTDGFVSALTSAKGLDQIKTMFKNIGDALGQAGPGIRDFTAAMLTLSTEFSKKLPGMAQSFNNWASKVLTWVDKITTVDASGTSQFDRAMSSLGETLSKLGSTTGDLFIKGLEWISKPENTDKVINFINDLKTAIDGLWPVLDKTFTRIEQLANTVAPLIQGAGMLSDLTGQNKTGRNYKAPDANAPDGGSAGQKAWDGFKNGFLQALDPAWLGSKISELFTSIPWGDITSGMVTFFSDMGSRILSVFSGAWDGIVSGFYRVNDSIANAGSAILTEVGSWPGKIQSFFSDAINWLVDAGRNVVQGLINGISGMIDSAVAKAKELAGAVKNAVTSFLGIHSPSTVMAAIGGFIGDGLINGLKSKQGEIEKTVKGISQGIKDGLDMSDYAQRGIDAGFAFAGANADQLMSDLGIGGKGFISQLGEQGLKFGMDFAGKALTQNFYTSNVDDTIAVKNNQLNKQALGVVGKSG
ncbi:hypothetical protein PP336_11790 [Mycobacteroides abscessus]|uniref:phage tail protein n=1 Tax=Mycobacteroides abscessus TaxID=36809 RepID=UPI00187762BB|nr:hypothetical protein [Mycobacteroides abscessus]MBE5437933.1 hypothetical protein [Mycobacteroides abscessus]MBN7445793.1 hypothetical protein [Mycobacteroides abscessus subsp. abscessus]MDM1901341.1 hypothetical protein [Mycobacteroides abscessus]MDM1961126.1 hypothetical protein [Mycobacteroides abscessus]MDM1965722.1 hypothetical protein [Mycobacteroides abscessus]